MVHSMENVMLMTPMDEIACWVSWNFFGELLEPVNIFMRVVY